MRKKTAPAVALLLLALPAWVFFHPGEPDPEPAPVRKHPRRGYYGSLLYGHKHEKLPYTVPYMRGGTRITIDSATLVVVPELFPRYFRGIYQGRRKYPGRKKPVLFYSVETSDWPQFSSNDLPWNYE